MITHLLAAVMAIGLTAGTTPELPTPNDLTLAQAARLYRIAVYDTFHTDRAEYDRRRAEWTQLDDAWQAAGRPDKDLPEVLNWLERATAASQPESISPLPDAPKIVADPEAKRKVAAPWQIVVPPPVENAAAPESNPKASMTPSSDAHQGGNPATPVSSKTTLQGPLLEEPKPADETAPVPRAVAPSSTAPGNAQPQPTANVDDSAWLYSLGHEIGQDLSNFALGLSGTCKSK